ncbi:hypothetical protein F2P56_010172 [Juglans regia]|uniref:glucan endo-1,3-beta-D-glucosidase n=1 Tax=Juglans regia TaxID=51240 RepID=A0A834D299_JUGRE|nr:hypothetical protein F2P56_010172 [Juglans regia]
MSRFWIALILYGLAAVHNHIGTAVADFDGLGVCYGTLGTDIPDPRTTVQVCHSHGFKKIRLFKPDLKMMDALINQNIAVSIGIGNDELPNIGTALSSADKWYSTNVKPYISKVAIEYIVVGNEAIPGPYAKWVASAVRNLKQVLFQSDQDSIKVTTAISTSVLGATIPPSKGIFKAETRQMMVEVIQSISERRSAPVLMVHAYPYRYHAAGLIRQDFATFSLHKPYYHDNGKNYWNMLDVLVDAFYSAMAKEIRSGNQLRLIVGASGWPSAGNGRFTTPALAAIYNQNFMRRVVRRQGTPAQPEKFVDGFIYALFNENKKPGDPADQHYGLLNTDKTPVYHFVVPQSPMFPPIIKI